MVLPSAGLALSQGENYYSSLHRGYPGVMSVGLAGFLEPAGWLMAFAVAGNLAMALFIRSGTGGPAVSHDRADAVGRVRWLALAWGAVSTVLVPLVAADNNGVSADKVLGSSWLDFIESTEAAQAWIVPAAVGGFLAVLLRRDSTWTTLFLGFCATVVSMVLPLVNGQVSVGADHDFASDAATIGVVALLFWAGLSLGMTKHIARGGRVSEQGFRRFHLTATTAAPIVILSHGAVLWFGLAGHPAFDSTYGIISVLGLVAAVGAGLVAWRRLIRWKAGNPSDSSYRWFLTSELLLLSIFIGSRQLVERTVPPRFLAPQSIHQNFVGYDISTTPTVADLVGFGRANLLFLTISVGAVGFYSWALSRVRRNAGAWPRGRTVSWILGWIVVAYVTSSGIGERAAGSFSLHMIVHMSLNMLVPVLLVMGGPVTLALRAFRPATKGAMSGPREWITTLMHSRAAALASNPLVIYAVFVASYYVLYFTSLFETALRYHWSHQALNLHLILIGYLFYWIAIGVDRAPRPLPHIGRLGFTFAAMPFHAFFAIAIMSSTTVIAENFYKYLAVPWNTDLLKDQYLGGGIAWGTGEIPLLIVVLALVTQWARSDGRGAKRTDRSADSGLDANLAGYNAMLAALAERNERNGM